MQYDSYPLLAQDPQCILGMTQLSRSAVMLFRGGRGCGTQLDHVTVASRQ